VADFVGVDGSNGERSDARNDHRLRHAQDRAGEAPLARHSISSSCARVTREGGPETSRSRLRQLRRKHSNPPAPNAEAVIGRLGERPALPRDEKWAENSPSAHRTRIIQNPIAEFWSSKCLRAITFFKCAPWKYSFSCGASLTNGLGFDTGAISKILLARVDEMAVSEC
jgi:hypothetical protein